MSGGWATTRPVALDMLTVQLADELRDTPNKVNSSDPGFTATDLNGHRGYQTVEQDGAETIRLALLPANGPTGRFFSVAGPNPWWRASLRSWKGRHLAWTGASVRLFVAPASARPLTRTGTVNAIDSGRPFAASHRRRQAAAKLSVAFGGVQAGATPMRSSAFILSRANSSGVGGVRVREAGGRSRKAYLARTSWITRPRHWRP
jgi:hypothetical protein